MPNTTWNPADKAAITLSNGDKTAAGSVGGAGSFGAVRSVAFQTTGKYYWEYTPTVLNQTSTGFGIGNASTVLPPTGVYNNACAVGFPGNVFLNGGSASVAIGSLSTGGSGRSCFALDMTNKLLWIRGSAAGQWNNGGSANPATGVGGIDITVIAGTGIYALFVSSSTDACTANFGDSAFSGVVPSGFTSGFPTGGGAVAAQARVMVLA